MPKSFEIKYKLSDLKGAVIGTFTRIQLATKSLNDEQLAARHVAWLARNLNLGCEIISAKASNVEAVRLAPKRCVVETSKERSLRLARERRQAKKQAVAA